MLGKGEYFVLMADVDSMTDAGIDDGDFVIVRKTNTADYGKIVVALDNDNRNTLKRLCKVNRFQQFSAFHRKFHNMRILQKN